MASPAYLHCTGAIFCYTVNSSGSISQLGTAEQHPVSEDDYNWEDVFNDIGGSMVPFDQMYMGQIEIFSLDLNRFNNDVSFFIESAPSYSVLSQTQINVPGYDDWVSRGSFLNANSQGFPLWLQYSFFGTAGALAYPDLPIGVYYPNCRLIKSITPEQGTKTWKKRLEIMAFPDFLFESDGSWNFTVKSSNPSDFAAIAGIIPS